MLPWSIYEGRRSCFHLNFLQGEEAIPLIKYMEWAQKCEVWENAQDVFPTFPEVLILPIKYRGEFEVQNMYFQEAIALENKIMGSEYLEMKGRQKK